MWRASPLKKVRMCRRYAADPDATTVPLRMSTGADGRLSVGFGNVKVCGSWSCCVVCGAKLAVHRAEELAQIFGVWHALGGTVVMATFSARHGVGAELEHLVTGLRSGWAAVKSGRPWAKDAADLGIGWTVRAFEVTHGDEHAWHPHYHAFFLVNGPVSLEMAETVCDRMWARWCEGLSREGMTAVARVRGKSAGFDVRVMQAGSQAAEFALYPFKMALEAVGAVFKRGREIDAKGNERGYRHRTPFEIFEHYAVAVAEDDRDDAAANWTLIDEYSRVATAMRFRQCPLPPGMREYFAAKAAELGIEGPLLEPERTDKEIAEDETPGAETLGHVPVDAYTLWIVYEMDTLRAAARTGGVPAVLAWFEQRDIPFRLHTGRGS